MSTRKEPLLPCTTHFRYTGGSAAAQPAFAQFAQRTEPVGMDMVSRIRQEAFHHSQVMQTLAELTEDVGPRLTNSPNMDKANDWAKAKLSGWGLVNVQIGRAHV